VTNEEDRPAGCRGRTGGVLAEGEKLLERAEGSLARGEYRAAMIDLQNYLSDHPENAAARAQLGIALLELGDVNGAEAEIRKAASWARATTS